MCSTKQGAYLRVQNSVYVDISAMSFSVEGVACLNPFLDKTVQFHVPEKDSYLNIGGGVL